MRDYSYPSVYFAYFFFVLLLGGALFFFFRSIKHGYWSEKGEEVKYRMLEDDGQIIEEKPPAELRRPL